MNRSRTYQAPAVGFCCVLVFFMLLLLGAAEAGAVSLTIDGKANIFGAGHSTPPAPGGGGGGILPPSAGFATGPNLVLTFSSVAGSVSCCDATTYNGPDGGTWATGTTDITSYGGLSGIIHSDRTMFLTGVFLSDAEPTQAPSRLSFSDPEDFVDLNPSLSQVFFIGDGLTDTGGMTQRFHVPTGATRLFLGFADAFNFGNPSSPPGYYADNLGSLTADFSITAIPEPASLLLLGSGLIGCVVLKRKGRTR